MPRIREGWETHYHTVSHYGLGNLEVHDGDEVEVVVLPHMPTSQYIAVSTCRSRRGGGVNHIPNRFIIPDQTELIETLPDPVAVAVDTIAAAKRLMATNYILCNARNVCQRYLDADPAADNDVELCDYLCNEYGYTQSEAIEIFNDVAHKIYRAVGENAERASS